MARAKKTTDEDVQVDEDGDEGEVLEPLRSLRTGALLDPIDGRPIFADGMSRRRWLAADADARHAAGKAELLAELERMKAEVAETEKAVAEDG
jgi:hypothetical protein